MSANSVMLFFYLMFACFIFNKTKWISLVFLNNFFDVFFWKLTSLLSNSRSSIYIILTLYFITLYIIKKSHQNVLTIIIIFYFFFNIFINYNITSLLIFNKAINIALLNGVLNIHPWLMYIVYSYILYTYFDFWKFSKKKKTLFRVFLTKLIKKIYLFLISLSILLGGYWAFQELSWGGWWNWDIVELLSLYFFFIIVSLIHKKYVGLIYTKSFNYIIVIAALLSLLIIKFNVINSIHSFVTNNQFKIVLYKYIMISFYTLTLVLFLSHKSNTNVRIKFFKKQNYIFINIIIIVLIICVQIINQYFLKNSYVDYLYTIGFIFMIFYIYTGTHFKNFIKNKQKKYHYNIYAGALCVFFLKIYFYNYSIYIEILGDSYNTFNNFSINNNFLKKFKCNWFPQNYCQIWLNNNNSVFNINVEVFIHFYKNWIIYFNNFFFKIIRPNNSAVFLSYSNIFFALLFFYYYFLKKNSIVINSIVIN